MDDNNENVVPSSPHATQDVVGDDSHPGFKPKKWLAIRSKNIEYLNDKWQGDGWYPRQFLGAKHSRDPETMHANDITYLKGVTKAALRYQVPLQSLYQPGGAIYDAMAEQSGGGVVKWTGKTARAAKTLLDERFARRHHAPPGPNPGTGLNYQSYQPVPQSSSQEHASSASLGFLSSMGFNNISASASNPQGYSMLTPTISNHYKQDSVPQRPNEREGNPHGFAQHGSNQQSFGQQDFNQPECHRPMVYEEPVSHPAVHHPPVGHPAIPHPAFGQAVSHQPAVNRLVVRQPWAYGFGDSRPHINIPAVLSGMPNHAGAHPRGYDKHEAYPSNSPSASLDCQHENVNPHDIVAIKSEPLSAQFMAPVLPPTIEAATTATCQDTQESLPAPPRLQPAFSLLPQESSSALTQATTTATNQDMQLSLPTFSQQRPVFPFTPQQPCPASPHANTTITQNTQQYLPAPPQQPPPFTFFPEQPDQDLLQPVTSAPSHHTQQPILATPRQHPALTFIPPQTGVAPSEEAPPLPTGNVCPFCKKIFGHHGSMIRHWQSRHPDGKVWYCAVPTCGRRLPLWGKFRYERHMRDRHPDEVDSQPDIKTIPWDNAPDDFRKT